MRDKNQSAKIFGQVLREQRLAHGYTQDKLAELAKVDRSHISSLERATRSPLIPTLFILAEALDMSASQLIDIVEQRLKTS
jgi:XRE family transcriptional regulator, regulator of sulfur utilization